MGVIFEKRKAKYKNVWLEKHRPEELKEMVLEDNHKRKFDEFIEDGSVPNMLLIGPPGTGKTTVAYILIDHVINNDMDFLEMNGSLTRGIGAIAGLDDFIKSRTVMSKKKIIFIDEADKLTPDAQDALRGVIEQNSDHLAFIFTANYEYKFSDAILSRMQTYRMKKLPYDYVQKFITSILEKENITFQKEDLDYVISATYPDVRKCMNEINKCVFRSENGLVLDLGNTSSDFLCEHKFVETLLLIEKNYKAGLDYVSCIKQAYEYIYADTMNYYTVFEKINENIKGIKMKTLSAHFFNEINKVISPKYLTMEFLGEFLGATIK